MTTTTAGRGGAWLIGEVDAATVLTRERLGDEHRLIGHTADAFVDNEVLPVLDRLEQKDWGLARTLIRRCGDLGFLGADVPEAYGGVDLDAAAALVIGESVGRCASFATTFGAQTGLTLTPLVCFGSAEQQRKYVPRLVSGDLIGAYALSEPGSGSDALSARARAVALPDGSFVLSGEKMWITNGGFADVFIVFAQVAGEPVAGEPGADRFTAFIVERGFPGVSCGQEEHKMGLHGSSTTPLLLQDVPVPAGNVLGEVGKGHRVAFNVLNWGRCKLGAMCTGGARLVIGQAAAYAAERKQFGRPIASFGAVRHKLAEMAIRTYVVEAMLFRTAGLLDGLSHTAGGRRAMPEALEEFAVEASILKVAGSEMMDFVVDENVQIHGGNGFVRDYAAERHYRDARVNRIFEGTNEINRLLIPGMLARRAGAGRLAIVDAAARLRNELLSPSPPVPPGAVPLDLAGRTVAGMKKVALAVLATAMKTYGKTLGDQQGVLTRVADIVIDVYGAESAVIRARAAGATLHASAASVFANDAAARVEVAARDALAAMAGGDALQQLLLTVQQCLRVPPLNTVALRDELAGAVVERRVYPF